MTHTLDISQSAMLVSVTLSQFSPTVTDKAITAETNARHGVTGDMGKYKKSLIVRDKIKPISAFASEIRQEHYRRTLPWSEDGSRILTSSGYLDYARWMREAKSKWDSLVSDFVTAWPDIVEDARVRLNGAFNPNEYPDASEIRGKFGFRWSVRPVPVADDFRVSLGSAEVSVIRAEIEAEVQSTVQTAMKDVFTRMRDTVGKMAERLRAYDPTKPKDAPFRDTLVTNIRDLLDLIPSLNLTHDPNVDFFVEEMETLIAHDAQTLRGNYFVREDVAKKAEEIYNAMAAYVA